MILRIISYIEMLWITHLKFQPIAISNEKINQNHIVYASHIVINKKMISFYAVKNHTFHVMCECFSYIYIHTWKRMQNGIQSECNKTSDTSTLIQWILRSTKIVCDPTCMLTISFIDIFVDDNNAKIWHSFNAVTNDLLY